MKVLITGATGFVGHHLCRELTTNGHKVVVITRNLKSAKKKLVYPVDFVEHDLGSGPLPREVLNGVDSVVNLAGSPIAEGRWTSQRKELIYASRIKTTQNLVTSINETQSIQSFVSASAIGFYPFSETETMHEDNSPGDHFMAKVCRDWESEAKKAFIEPSIVRIGLVMGRNDGMLGKLEPMARAGIASPLGNARQWMSWIHIYDLVQIFMRFALNPEPGIYNGVAPHPITNKNFTKELNAKLGKWTPPRAPAPVLKLAAGEMSQLLLCGANIKSKLIDDAFVFKRFRDALDDIFGPDGKCQEFFQEQWFPQSMKEVFKFFSSEKNLEKITPPWLNFHVLSMSTQNIEQDTKLHYKLKIHGFPVKWTTRIAEWNPPDHFQDQQLKGPYRVWQHDHFFKECGSGTLMQDRVRYRVPMGTIGSLIAGKWVRGDIHSIFKFREKTIASLFDSNEN